MKKLSTRPTQKYTKNINNKSRSQLTPTPFPIFHEISFSQKPSALTYRRDSLDEGERGPYFFTYTVVTIGANRFLEKRENRIGKQAPYVFKLDVGNAPNFAL